MATKEKPTAGPRGLIEELTADFKLCKIGEETAKIKAEEPVLYARPRYYRSDPCLEWKFLAGENCYYLEPERPVTGEFIARVGLNNCEKKVELHLLAWRSDNESEFKRLSTITKRLLPCMQLKGDAFQKSYFSHGSLVSFRAQAMVKGRDVFLGIEAESLEVLAVSNGKDAK
jgi:hypothetical protein